MAKDMDKDFILDDEVESSPELDTEGDIFDGIEDSRSKPVKKKKVKQKKEKKSKAGLVLALLIILLLSYTGFILDYFGIINIRGYLPWLNNSPEISVEQGIRDISSPTDNSKYTLEIDKSMLEVYRLMLVGTWKTDIDGQEYFFDFRSNESYSGYSNLKAEDIGRWEILTDGTDYTIIISCRSEAVDVYSYFLNNNGEVVLTSTLGSVYTLHPAY